MAGAFLLALAAGLFLPGKGEAQTIIYQDTFSRTGALNGSSPTTGTGTWTVLSNGSATVSPNTTNLTTDGSLAQFTDPNTAASGDNVIGSLAFTAQANTLYTLSATITVTSGNWLAIGFAGDTNGGNGANGYAWILQQTSNLVQAFGGPGATNSVAGVTGSAGDTLQVTLNTATKVATFYVGSTQEATYTFTSLPALSDIFIEGRDSSTQNLAGSLDNLTLTATAVPEAGTLGLLGLSGAMTLLGVALRGRTAQVS